MTELRMIDFQNESLPAIHWEPGGKRFLIFTRIAFKAIKNSIILVSLFAVTSFSTRKIWTAPGAGQLKIESLANPTQQFPNGELERVQHPSSAGWNITAQKNLVPPGLSPGIFVYKEQVHLKSLLVKTSSLRVKDYLLHIHPSHHFW